MRWRCDMRSNRTALWLVVLAVFAMQAGAQVLTTDQAKKLAPTTYYFAGKIVLAGFVDTSGYSTSIKEKYQGFLITETKLSFDGATLDPGEYGFGFKDGKFIVMNVASTDLFSIASPTDDQLKHP